MNKKTIKVSIIIPSIDGYREGMLPKLLEQIKNQTFKDLEVIIKKGDNRQGRAINNGAKEAIGDYLIIMDDDIILGKDNTIENLINAIETDTNIGMAGASLKIWENAAWLQKKAMGELPRYTSPLFDKITDSDYACHGCCIFRKDIFFAVGAEREEIIRGLDPDLRMRLRNAGYRIVMVPDTWFYHLPPATYWGILKKFFRNGKGSSFIQTFHPDLIFETDEGQNKFHKKRSFLYRIFRFPFRLIDHLVHLRFIAFSALSSYLAGFVWGYLLYNTNKLIGTHQDSE